MDTFILNIYKLDEVQDSCVGTIEVIGKDGGGEVFCGMGELWEILSARQPNKISTSQ